MADEGYAADIRRFLVAQRLQDAVTLSGMVRDVRPRVTRWDLFVSLSSDEGQGLAVLEGQARALLAEAGNIRRERREQRVRDERKAAQS